MQTRYWHPDPSGTHSLERTQLIALSDLILQHFQQNFSTWTKGQPLEHYQTLRAQAPK